MEQTREQRLERCKERAREYLAIGEVKNAICSMMSDLEKEPDIGMPQAIAMLGLMVAMRDDEIEARRWIEGFR